MGRTTDTFRPLLAVAALALAVAAVLAFAAVVAPRALAFSLPLGFDSQQTLEQQFGYAPGYELNIPSFDPSNQPLIRSRTASQHETEWAMSLRNGVWVKHALLDAVRSAYPGFVETVNAGGYVSERIETDSRGRAYTLLEIRVRSGRLYNVLLYSLDGCATWSLVTLPFGGTTSSYDGRDNGTASLEQYAGWNTSSRPPLVAIWRPMAEWPGKYASLNWLYVVKPRFRAGRLVLPAPALVTKRFIGMTYAAGGASFAASTETTSYLVWAAVSKRGATGTPNYVGSYDIASGKMTGRRLLASPRPRNDAHDTPGIVRDGDGYLHVVTGAHNASFYYLHSEQPLDIHSWTTPEPTLVGGYIPSGGLAPGATHQTYLSLACLPDESLVIAFRQGRCGVDSVFGGAPYDALSVQRRSPDGVWSAAQPLVYCADRDGYALFNQKLTVDHAGRLYLSLSYFSPTDYPPADRAANRFSHRMVLISKDGGTSWDFATDADFVEGTSLAQ